MELFDDGSDPPIDESQPTQLLQNVLDAGADVRRRTNNSDRSAHGLEPHMANDPSNATSRQESGSPRYHFHGLAATQTPTQQHDDDYEFNESSQKENFKATSALGEIKTSGTHHPGSPYASSSRNFLTTVAQVDQSSSSPSHTPMAQPKPTTAKSVAFQYPLATKRSELFHVNPTDTPGKPHPTTHAPSRANNNSHLNDAQFSQDSFAESLSQDPEQQFLAVSKQFDVPLSELGRVSPTDQRSKSPMFAYSAQARGAVRAPSSPQGRVLVAATPSSSGSSRSQEQPSQASGDPQDADMFMEEEVVDTAYDASDNVGAHERTSQSTQGYESTEPSSSYGRFVNGEPDPVTASKIIEYQATQPSTQVDADMTTEEGLAAAINRASNNAAASGGRPSNAHSGPMSSYNTTRSTAPRSILSMVDPRKNWKYAQYQQVLPSAKQLHTQAAARDLGPSPLMQETHPSGDDPIPSIPSRGFGPKHQIHPTMPSKPLPDVLRSKMSSRHQHMPSNQTMDVVPDSEPLQDDRPSTPGSSVKDRSRVISPGSGTDLNSGDIVLDSADAKDKEERTIEDGDGEVRGTRPLRAEMEEEEEDIPLAVITSKWGPRNEANAVPANLEAPSTRQQRDVSEVTPLPRAKRSIRPPKADVAKSKQKQTPEVSNADTIVKDIRMTRAPGSAQSKKKGHVESWEMGVVPSSAPNQDLNNAPAGPSSKSEKVLVPKSNTKTRTRTRSIPPTFTTAKRRRVTAREEDVDDADELSELDDELLVAKVEDNEGTEPADDDYSDVSFHDAGPSSRKRKRGTRAVKSKASKIGTKTSIKSTKLSHNTPSTRQMKRLRSVPSTTASRSSVVAATRVFALWKQDGHYYSGVVHSLQARSRYLIKFDDNTEGTVNIDQMRQCELKLGDDVIVADKSRNAKVVSLDKLDSDDVVGVDVDDKYVEVEMLDIRIASKTISYAWKDRKLSPELIATVVKPAKLLKSSPSPSKQSLLSTASTRRKLFAKTGLVVTLSAGNENWERDKDRIMLAIKNNGGTVIDDWANIIDMDGNHSHSNKRWVVHKDQVRWNGKEGIERVFLLADDANQKPKYLIALALGVPCLSMNWLHDSADSGDEKDWMGYMLPQGFSEHLNARVSQFVDLDWGNSIHHLTDIMSNQVASKILDDLSVLCVNAGFVPLPKGKKVTGVDDKSRAANSSIPRIILSMGAKRVEAVSELKFASQQPSAFDYVVIKDVEDYTPEFGDCTTVHLGWVKNCLIAGRRLPLPGWS